MHMASQGWPCSACAYYLPYPKWKGVGTCDNTLSRSYDRMAIGSAGQCEYYADPRTTSRTGRHRVRGARSKAPRRAVTACIDCHYWLPFEMMPRVGQCDNPSSQLFGKATFSDKPTEDCYADRSLDGLEFMWCQSHRQTIYSGELPDHKGCRIFVSSVSLPVEDEMELTLAGD
jgi:hypothetical protein